MKAHSQNCFSCFLQLVLFHLSGFKMLQVSCIVLRVHPSGLPREFQGSPLQEPFCSSEKPTRQPLIHFLLAELPKPPNKLHPETARTPKPRHSQASPQIQFLLPHVFDAPCHFRGITCRGLRGSVPLRGRVLGGAPMTLANRSDRSGGKGFVED